MQVTLTNGIRDVPETLAGELPEVIGRPSEAIVYIRHKKVRPYLPGFNY